MTSCVLESKKGEIFGDAMLRESVCDEEENC
jgi:hypothetical protein